MLTVRAGSKDAPLLLLVHGLGENGFTDWLPVMPMLARRYRVLAVDLPGFGYSSSPQAKFSPANYARVLANLLENVSKYTPSQSPVEVLVHPTDQELRVSVRDHGPGVAPGQEDAIFEKFTRGNTESATPGVGLGLAICRAIVEAHRGRIWVESSQPRGATFTFSLPRGTPPAIDLSDAGPGAT